MPARPPQKSRTAMLCLVVCNNLRLLEKEWDKEKVWGLRAGPNVGRKAQAAVARMEVCFLMSQA